MKPNMEFSQWIGFIISLAAIVFLIFRNFQEALQQKRHPEESRRKERAKHQSLKQLLKSMDIDVEDDEEEEDEEQEFVRSPPPQVARKIPLPQKPHASGSAHVETYQRETAGDKRRSEAEKHRQEIGLPKQYKNESTEEYKVTGKGNPSRAYGLIHEGRTLQEMIVLQEILNPPKALRRDELSHH